MEKNKRRKIGLIGVGHTMLNNMDNHVLPFRPEKRRYFFADSGFKEETEMLVTDPNCYVDWINNCDDNNDIPLIKASYFGIPSLIEALLQKQDLPINHQNENGQTALSFASACGNIRCVELLLDDPRVDVNLTNNVGLSPLSWAYATNDIFIMKLLISHGAANVDGVAESVLDLMKQQRKEPSSEATEVMGELEVVSPRIHKVR